MKKSLRIIMIVLAVSIAVLLAVYLVKRQGQTLPDWIRFYERSETADITGDGTPEEITLSSKRFSISMDGETIFASDEEWQVVDFIIHDIDADGSQEIVLLLWKLGNYGSSRPFWVDEDEDEDVWSEHIFVYRWDDGRVKPIWMSSDVGLNTISWNMGDDRLLHITDKDGNETVWIWAGFGFALIEDTERDTAVTAETASITLIAAGDNIAYQGIYAGVKDGTTYDFSPIYENVKDIISASDIAVVNQETVLVTDQDLISGYPEFGTPISMADALADAGFNVVTAATNHIMDKWDAAVGDMISWFDENYPDISLLGVHDSDDDAHYEIIEVNGITLALFSYTSSLNGHYPSDSSGISIDLLDNKETLLRDLAEAETQADISVCFLHFGTEYASEPDDEQISLCEELIDAGADLIIGTHPHVLEPVCKVVTQAGNSGIVFYSLGNFVANQPVYETVLGGLASVAITKTTANGYSETEIESYELIPVVCHYSYGYTRVFLLDSYTDELAAEHYVSRQIREFTVADLEELYKTIVYVDT